VQIGNTPPHAVVEYIDDKYNNMILAAKEIAMKQIIDEFGEYSPGLFQELSHLMMEIWLGFVTTN